MLQLHYLLLCKLSNTDLRPLLLATKRSKAFLHASSSPLPPSGKAAGLHQGQVFAMGTDCRCEGYMPNLVKPAAAYVSLPVK